VTETNRKRITPAGINRVVIAEKYQGGSSQAAERGRIKHSQIIGQAIRGTNETLSGFQQNFGPLRLRGEVLMNTVLTPNLELRARIDLLDEENGIVIEIKPGIKYRGKIRPRERDLLQTTFNCMIVARNSHRSVHGVVYTYNHTDNESDKSFTLATGGEEFWPQATELAILASRLTEREKVFDRQNNSKPRQLTLFEKEVVFLTEAEIIQMKNESISDRRKFDPLLEEIVTGLWGLIR